MTPKRVENSEKDRPVTEAYLDVRLEETKQEIKTELTDEIRGATVKVLRAVDGLATRFDTMEKDQAAHTHLHKRITDDLHGHEQRIRKLEVRR